MNGYYEQQIEAILRKWGGFREKEIMRKPHTVTLGETWNNEHKVIYITEKEVQADGYSNGFAVDIVTHSICG